MSRGGRPVSFTLSLRLTQLIDASDQHEDEIMIPYYIGLQPYGFYRWNIYTAPQQQLDGASREVPVGKGVGGGSLINGLIWNRGNQESYNTWNELGNFGWGWNDLLPYFKKVSGGGSPWLGMVATKDNFSPKHTRQKSTQTQRLSHDSRMLRPTGQLARFMFHIPIFTGHRQTTGLLRSKNSIYRFLRNQMRVWKQAAISFP